MSENNPKPKATGSHKKPNFEEPPFALKLTKPDAFLLGVSVLFIIVAAVEVMLRVPGANLYEILTGVHFQLSRYGLAVALVMLVIAVYVGIFRKEDVKPWFRRGTFVVFGTMTIQSLIGAYMMFILEIQPGKPEHLIYGIGSVLALPFFIFVETTSPKRPAMGSYIWGFALLIGVLIRSLGTGPVS